MILVLPSLPASINPMAQCNINFTQQVITIGKINELVMKPPFPG